MSIKKIGSIILSLILVFALAGCGNDDVNNSNAFKMPKNIATANSGVVAQNDDYNLLWDGDSAVILLQNRSTGVIWSSTPYDYYKSEHEENVYIGNNVCSPIIVKYFEASSHTTQVAYGYDAVSYGNVYSKKIKNGVRVIFFFEDIEIAIPVDFTLSKDGLVASVLVDQIMENENMVEEITILPSFASAKNNTNSYLFIPSGSGALMNVDDTTRNIRYYSEPVYGQDAAFRPMQSKVNTETVRLPVFGVKNENNSLFGIIENGADMAIIDATAGDAGLLYSFVGATFSIRSYADASMKNTNKTTAIVHSLSASKAKCKSASVKYIPTDGYSAGYQGFAEVYREYLQDKGYLADKEENVNMFLSLLGGTNISESFFGVPYKALAPITTMDDAYDIVKELSDKYGSDMVFNLFGYGNGGLDSRYIAGEYKIAKQLGSLKKLTKLNKLCKSTDNSLIMDFDLIFYSKSGSGFSTSKSVAKTANSLPAKKTGYNLITREIDSSTFHFVLGRDNLLKAGSKLKEKTNKWDIDGISLSSLSSVAYSDCNDQNYYAKNNMAKDAKKIIKENKGKNKKFAAYKANSYAALLSDYIYTPPIQSSKYYALDTDIPFYQMIFKGNIALTSSPINLAVEPNEVFLKAMSTGSALEFTVASSFRDEFVSTNHSGIAGSSYDSVKDLMEKYSAMSSKYLKSVSGANIRSYTISGKLAHTVFSNGVEVYVNFGSSAANTPFGSVDAGSFIYSK